MVDKVYVFFMVIITAFSIMAIAMLWGINKHLKQEIANEIKENKALIVLAVEKDTKIKAMTEEIQDLRISHRWATLFGIIMSKDRQIEFEMIEEHLQKKVYDGLIRICEE